MVTTTTPVTCYVDASTGQLCTIDTNESLRQATRKETRESEAELGGTGAILVAVADRTLRRRAPHYLALRSRWSL